MKTAKLTSNLSGRESKLPLVRHGALAISLFLILASSCGKHKGSSSSDSSQATNDPSNKTTISIPLLMLEGKSLSLNDNTSQNLALASNPGAMPAGSFSVTLANCVSGFSGTSTSSTINVLLYDTSCLVKLASFVVHGKTYSPTGTGSSPFTTWLAGDTAVFRYSDTDLITVKVVSQLSSPIQSTDYVSYNFESITGTSVPSIIVSASHSLFVAGQDSPNFSINSNDAQFTNIVPSGGSAGYGQFTFKLTCTNGPMIVGGHSPTTSFCPTSNGDTYASGAGVDIYGASNTDSTSLFSYKLILDSGGTGVLTLAQAQAAFAAGSDSTVSSSDLVGSTAFNTITLTGPGPVGNTSYSHMFLILQAKNANATYTSDTTYSSFQYFAITLSIPSF